MPPHVHFSSYVRSKIWKLYDNHFTSEEIASKLREDDKFFTTPRCIRRFLNRTSNRGHISTQIRPRTGPECPDEIVQFVKRMIEETKGTITAGAMRERLIEEKDFVLSESAICTARTWLGYSPKSVKYCQLVRDANKEKWVKFCLNLISDYQKLLKMVFTDESSIHIGSFRQKIYVNCDDPDSKFANLRSRPKHPYKVMIWGGISWNGPTDVIIILPKTLRQRQNKDPTKPPEKATVTSKVYKEILAKTILPFAQRAYPDGDYMLVADSAPCHKSKQTMDFYKEKSIPYDPEFWPPESPDLNVIEMLWHELKLYLDNVYDPQNKQELIDGINYFWHNRLTVEKCRKYITHIFKVIPDVLANEGGPSTH